MRAVQVAARREIWGEFTIHTAREGASRIEPGDGDARPLRFNAAASCGGGRGKRSVCGHTSPFTAHLEACDCSAGCRGGLRLVAKHSIISKSPTIRTHLTLAPALPHVGEESGTVTCCTPRLSTLGGWRSRRSYRRHPPCRDRFSKRGAWRDISQLHRDLFNCASAMMDPLDGGARFTRWKTETILLVLPPGLRNT